MLWKKLVQFGKGLIDRKDESTSTDMPLGIAIHNIKSTLGKGGKLARAAGAAAKLIAKEDISLYEEFEENMVYSKKSGLITKQNEQKSDMS
ncbi:hypothetical protein Dsin_025392 [Dipteronia sinensis]|uniref:Large ribosomal subunit protein uL2 C-terminal domain-containing protein n=1 Tax=Dipteronia sinensis TaxID=43782 RepID=A0AAD9ZW79_9ROSI|nr:hypothetical protein Dsin_025392 [Dipteronia sinensis]